MRYPGGKSRAVALILSYFPKHLSRICSPFLGGGSIELALAQQGIKVFAYDNFKPLIDFWQELIHNPKRLCTQVQQYYPLPKRKFYQLQKNYGTFVRKEQRAAAFFVLNRASFSGATFKGGMSFNHPRFTQKTINRLATFSVSHFQVQHMDFTESMATHTHDFLYLDPPYYNGQQLYGNSAKSNSQFDHERLAELLHKRNNWILSYNDCLYIRKVYRGYKIVRLHWKYGMNKTKESNELLILSKRVSNL